MIIRPLEILPWSNLKMENGKYLEFSKDEAIEVLDSLKEGNIFRLATSGPYEEIIMKFKIPCKQRCGTRYFEYWLTNDDRRSLVKYITENIDLPSSWPQVAVLGAGPPAKTVPKVFNVGKAK